MPGRAAPVVLALVLGLPVALSMAAEAFLLAEVSSPRPFLRGQAVELLVTTGALPRGARVVLSTEAGEVIGAVAPFPPGSGTRATVPVPPGAVADGRLRVRLQVVGPGGPARAPRAGEVARLDLVVAGVGE